MERFIGGKVSPLQPFNPVTLQPFSGNSFFSSCFKYVSISRAPSICMTRGGNRFALRYLHVTAQLFDFRN